jgi:hypothetical protein
MMKGEHMEDTGIISNLDKILRNLEDGSKKIIKNITKEKPEPRLITIWKPGKFHLGHLHALHKIKDFLDGSFDVKIVLALYPDPIDKMTLLDISNQYEVSKMFMNKFFSDVKRQPTISTIEQEFAKIPQHLIESSNKFKSLCVDENKLIDILQKSQSEYKLWMQNLSPKIAALLMYKEYDFLFAGSRHKKIWDFFKYLFETANVPMSYQEVYLVNFNSTSTDKEPEAMKSDKATAIYLTDEFTSIRLKVYNWVNRVRSHLFDNSRLLIQFFKFFIQPKSKGSPLEYNGKKFDNIYLLKELEVKEIAPFLSDQIELIVAESRDFLKKIIPTDKLPSQEINNNFMLSMVSRKYDAVHKIENLETVLGECNSTPDKYRKEYAKIIEFVINNYIDKCDEDSSYDKKYGYIKDFKSLLDKARVVDALLYIASKRHRDHYLHQFNVGALGSYLSDLYMNEESTLRQLASKNLGLED